MASITLALNVYQDCNVELTFPSPFQWWRISLMKAKFVYNYESLSAGTHTLSLVQRTYGLIADGPVKLKFNGDIEVISKGEKDPWPVPGAPPSLLTGSDTNWYNVVWGWTGDAFLHSAGTRIVVPEPRLHDLE